MWNIVLQVIGQGSPLKKEHDFDDDNQSLMINLKLSVKWLKMQVDQ